MKRKITAILAADIAGYSRLVSEDEEETLRRLTDYQRLFKEQINEAGGRVFKTAGDSVLAEFPSAVDALRTAVTVQESLRIRNQAYPASRQMAYRIGLTIGDVVDQDGDLLGDGVNIAARLETLAQPGGICVSKAMHDAVANKLTVGFKDMGLQTVKNIPTPVHAYSVTQERQAAAPAPTIAGYSLNSVLAGVAVAIASAGLVWTLQRPAATPSTPAASIATAPPPAVEMPETSVADRAPASSTTDATPPPSISAPDAPNTASTPSPAAPESAPSEAGKPTETAQSAAQSAAAAVKEDLAAASRLRPVRWTACRSEDTAAALQACGALASDLGMEGERRAEAQRRLGYAQRKNGDVDAAVKSLTDSIGIAPTAVAYNDRGTAYLIKGDNERALADYDAAITLDPKNGEAWNNRAWMRYKAGDNRNALDDANRAVKLSPDKAFVWDTRAHIQEALGARKSAELDFLKAVGLDPALETSQAGLKRLTGR